MVLAAATALLLQSAFSALPAPVALGAQNAMALANAATARTAEAGAKNVPATVALTIDTADGRHPNPSKGEDLSPQLAGLEIAALTTSSAAATPFKAGPHTVARSHSWLALTIAQHGAATFDAWSTRRALASGGRYEVDPLIRPFARSPALYGAIQAGPALFDLLGRRMQHSENRWFRRLWWVPQSLSMAGFIYSGAHNVENTR